jgi:trans-aconitate methyltransferase
MSDRKSHWENVYNKSSPLEVSWYQKEPDLSLQLIRNSRIAVDAPIIDVGGGASVLVDYLCEAGYTNIEVLDIATMALAHAKERLAEKACGVEWHNTDVVKFAPLHSYSLWHDRAVFHFLTEKADREKYVGVLKQALQPGGHLIIMAFAIDGPKKCSGLEIVQYDAEKLMAELGEGFELVEQGYEAHKTPAGNEQKFAYFHFVTDP